MKKFFKFAGSVAMLCAAVAGGIFAYKKFFAPETYEDDFDDDPEESASEEGETAGRGYVSLTPEEEKKEETAEAESEGNDSEETIEKAPEI